MLMKRLAIFASGAGSNFQAIADAVQSGKLQADLALLVCDQPEAIVINKAENLGVPIFVVRPKAYENKVAYEEAVLVELQNYGVDFIALAGYMRLIGSTLLRAYAGRVINVHPSLLPAFPGLHAIEQAIEARVRVTGVTIHYVDDGMDTGPIIAQKSVTILPEDTAQDVAERIHSIEHELYPSVLMRLLNEE